MPIQWLGDNFLTELGFRLFDSLSSGNQQQGANIDLQDLWSQLKVDHRADVEDAIHSLLNASDKERRNAGEKLTQWHNEWTQEGTENEHIGILAEKFLMFCADNTDESITEIKKGDETQTKRKIDRDVKAARADFEEWLVEATSEGKDAFEQRLEIIGDNPVEMFLTKMKNAFENFKNKHEIPDADDGLKLFLQRFSRIASKAASSAGNFEAHTDRLSNFNDRLEGFRRSIEP